MFNWRNDTHPMYINLDHRGDRKQHITEQLNKIDLTAERVRGVYYHELLTVVDPYSQYPHISDEFNLMASKSKGQVGCYFAHISAMLNAAKKGKSALIFEDDAFLCQDFNERMSYIEQFLNTHEWDVFWLGGTYHLEPTWHDIGHKNPDMPECTCEVGVDVERTDDPRIVRTYGCWSTAGYIVNINSIIKILDMLSATVHKSYAIDHNFILLEPFLNTYAMIPALIKQIDNHSDTYNNLNSFSNFASLGPHWYADRMEDVDPSVIILPQKL